MSDAVSEAQLALIKVMFPVVDLGMRGIPCRDSLKHKYGSKHLEDQEPVTSLAKE